MKRQTHPAATIAKLPTQDNNPFIPIVGPTQSSNSQQPFPSNTDSFSNTQQFSNAGDTLVDYLLPPNPNSQITSLNFQDPAANLQNVDNVLDVTSPTFSSSNNLNTFHSFQNVLPSSSPNFHNQINIPNQSATQNIITNDQVQSISFQNPPLIPSSATNLNSNPSSPSPSQSPPQPVNQLLSNKISNSNRESNFLVNQFPPFPAQIIPQINFARNEHIQQEKPTNQDKWELGFDANDILAPPRDDTGIIGEYDTINVSKFRKPNNIPGTQNTELTNGQIQSLTNQFAVSNQFPPSPPSPSSNQFPQFNPFLQNNFITQNDQFTPVNGQFTTTNNQIIASNNQLQKENVPNDQSNIIWGTQKQATNFNPTTNIPFLPTVPPSTNSLQNNQQIQNNLFNSPQLQSQHLNNLPFQLQNQNFPLETPLTSQFDSFLPQGTVSDHSFPPLNHNIRHFQKRQVSEEEFRDEYERESESKYKPKVGPVYSFVKTDKNGHFKWSVRHPSKR